MTFRRTYIDKFLIGTAFSGRVLDIGGKKENKKGRFSPPMDRVSSWEYVNIDAGSRPDYCCSADALTLPDETFDFVLMTEVLEHLECPEKSLSEAFRVLKKGGKLICTIPFLYPIHSDPYDFQRWLPQRIEPEFKSAGFSQLHLECMGGFFAVVYDLLYVALKDASKNSRALKNRIITRAFMPVIYKIFALLDKIYFYKSRTITTGFYISAVK